MKEQYDLIIVGAGPIGLACAIEAKRNNLSYLIIEKGALTNSLYNYPLYMTFFSTAERLEIGEIPFNCIAPKPGRQEALEYYRNIHKYFKFNLNLYEEVEAIISFFYKKVMNVHALPNIVMDYDYAIWTLGMENDDAKELKCL